MSEKEELSYSDIFVYFGPKSKHGPSELIELRIYFSLAMKNDVRQQVKSIFVLSEPEFGSLPAVTMPGLPFVTDFNHSYVQNFYV